jgi:predicted dipeptidase
MRPQIKQHLQNQRGPLKETIKKLVRIPSVIEEGDGKFPFGEAVDDALRKTLEIAGPLGFQTKYGDQGYYGYAQIGQGQDLVAVLGHLDVVPAGALDTWDTDPFDPVERDGKIYGRGAQDDKGPTLATMFAAKALLDAGVTLNKRLRFIFGTDEETLWRGVKRYLEREERPGMGFTPDSKFPLIHAEQGLLQFYLEGHNESGFSLKGGNAFNSVPDAVVYAGERQEKLAAKLGELDYDYERADDGIKVLGQAAHASVAEMGINAITRLCIALHVIGLESKVIRFVAQQVGEDPFATLIFGQCTDAPSGQLKFNVGKIDIGQMEQLSIDIRIPVTVPKEEIVHKLSTLAGEYGLAYREYDWTAPIYMPLDHPMIKTLIMAYREVTGDIESEPESSGGATFARSIENCVAFGPILPGRSTVAHQPNEYVVLEDLYLAMEVYAYALYELTR